MTTKIEDTIKNLVQEGRKSGYLTFTGMNKLMEDQFVPPAQMDQVFLALEEAGIDVVEDEDVGLVIQLQGDQRQNAHDFLTVYKICNKKLENMFKM